MKNSIGQSFYLVKWPRFSCICDFISLLMNLLQKKRPSFPPAYVLSANDLFSIIQTIFVSCFVCKLSSLSLGLLQQQFPGEVPRKCCSLIGCFVFCFPGDRNLPDSEAVAGGGAEVNQTGIKTKMWMLLDYNVTTTLLKRRFARREEWVLVAISTCICRGIFYTWHF